MGFWSVLTPKCLLAVLVAFVLQLLLLSDRTTAFPTRGLLRDLIERYATSNITPQVPPGGYPNSPATSNFPTDAQISEAFRRPAQNSYVFWTEINDPSGSDLARNFAREIGGVTIDDTFPAQYICEDNGDTSWWPNFVDRASGIYADHASGVVYLVTDSMNGLQRPSSTFIRVEQPSLVENFFEYITLVDAHNFNNQRTVSLLKSILVKRDDLNKTVNTIENRDSVNVAGYSFNWEGYGDDPNGYCQPKMAGPPYSAGNCGVHIVQYAATNEGLGPIVLDWPFNISLKDSNIETIGGIDIDIPGGNTFDLPSALPLTFEITPGLNGFGDSDPIKLAYGGWSALTQSPACNVGGYDHGYRQMDCGFPCA